MRDMSSTEELRLEGGCVPHMVKQDKQLSQADEPAVEERVVLDNRP